MSSQKAIGNFSFNFNDDKERFSESAQAFDIHYDSEYDEVRITGVLGNPEKGGDDYITVNLDRRAFMLSLSEALVDPLG